MESPSTRDSADRGLPEVFGERLSTTSLILLISASLFPVQLQAIQNYYRRITRSVDENKTHIVYISHKKQSNETRGVGFSLVQSKIAMDENETYIVHNSHINHQPIDPQIMHT